MLKRALDHFVEEAKANQTSSHPGAYSFAEARTEIADQTQSATERFGLAADPEQTQEDTWNSATGQYPIKDGARSSSQLPRELGNYEIVAELGRGGMGVVYKVRDIALNRVAALKVIRPHLGSQGGEAMDRFFRAARLWARLDHPSIARIYAVEQVDGIPYIVSQFIEGRLFPK